MNEILKAFEDAINLDHLTLEELKEVEKILNKLT